MRSGGFRLRRARARISFRFFRVELDEEIEERFQTAPARFGRPIRSRLARHILHLSQDFFSASGLGRLFLTWHSIQLLSRISGVGNREWEARKLFLIPHSPLPTPNIFIVSFASMNPLWRTHRARLHSRRFYHLRIVAGPEQ